MKAPDFDYAKPATLRETFDLLSRDGAVPLAGGQSLMATLNMRLSSPDLLVDITALDELKGIAVENDTIRIGALTRHVDLLRSPDIACHLPLLRAALHHVAHPAIRNRGTIGGSVANSDPAAELPACLLALNASVTLDGPAGRRTVPAERFFKGLFETDVQPGELIVEFRVPRLAGDQRWAFEELSRRRGDFALAGVAAVFTVAQTHLSALRLVFFGCSEFPKLAVETSAAVLARPRPLPEGDWLTDAIGRDISPTGAPGLRADTKLKLAAALVRRVFDKLEPEP